MQKAYAALREALLCGRYLPGELIVVREVADEMQFGTMPVRECVRQLTAEGALEFTPNRSVRVPELTVDEFQEVYEARILIEPFMAGKAAENVSRDQLQKISSYLDDIIAIKGHEDPHECLRANMHFHFEIYKASGSAQLVSIIERLWLRVCALLVVAYTAPRAQQEEFFSSYHLHQDLVAALKAHDAAKASATMSDILVQSRDWHLSYNQSLRKSAGKRSHR